MEQVQIQKEASDRAQRVNASVESLKPEFPGMGIGVIVQDALGTFTISSNIQIGGLAGLLRHAADHLDGKCKCG